MTKKEFKRNTIIFLLSGMITEAILIVLLFILG